MSAQVPRRSAVIPRSTATVTNSGCSDLSATVSDTRPARPTMAGLGAAASAVAWAARAVSKRVRNITEAKWKAEEDRKQRGPSVSSQCRSSIKKDRSNCEVAACAVLPSLPWLPFFLACVL